MIWSSNNCAACNSTIFGKITDTSGSGVFMESIQLASGSEVGVGVLRLYDNFVVVFAATLGASEDIRQNTTIRVNAKDKTVLYQQSPDRRIPKNIRENKHGIFPEGGTGGYLFFPYDDDAYDLTVEIETKAASLSFPFSRAATHMSFGDPAVVKAMTAASSPSQLPPEAKPRANRRSGTSADCDPAIETHIAGEFTGWDDETIYKMDNGQIWQGKIQGMDL
jgi:hypothetical protein